MVWTTLIQCFFHDPKLFKGIFNSLFFFILFYSYSQRFIVGLLLCTHTYKQKLFLLWIFASPLIVEAMLKYKKKKRKRCNFFFFCSKYKRIEASPPTKYFQMKNFPIQNYTITIMVLFFGYFYSIHIHGKEKKKSKKKTSQENDGEQ